MAQCIRKQNMDTMLWLLCLVRNRQLTNYSCIALQAFARYFAKNFMKTQLKYH